MIREVKLDLGFGGGIESLLVGLMRTLGRCMGGRKGRRKGLLGI